MRPDRICLVEDTKPLIVIPVPEIVKARAGGMKRCFIRTSKVVELAAVVAIPVQQRRAAAGFDFVAEAVVGVLRFQ